MFGGLCLGRLFECGGVITGLFTEGLFGDLGDGGVEGREREDGRGDVVRAGGVLVEGEGERGGGGEGNRGYRMGDGDGGVGERGVGDGDNGGARNGGGGSRAVLLGWWVGCRKGGGDGVWAFKGFEIMI